MYSHVVMMCPDNIMVLQVQLNGNSNVKEITWEVKDLNDLQQLVDKFINSTPIRMFTTSVFFYNTLVIPIHPETIGPVVTALNLPKIHTLTGTYRLLKPWIGDGLLVSNGKKWERNRRLLTPAFHFDILKPYVKVFGDVTEIFLGKLKQFSDTKTSVDIHPLVSRLTLHNMLRCTLSYDDESLQDGSDRHPYVSAVERLKYIVLVRLVFSEKIIQERKAAVAKDKTLLEKRYLDFLDILLTAQDEDGSRLTDREIRDEVDTFLFEGHDTTASAISWALHALAKYPEYQQRVREEVNEVFKGRQDIIADDLPKLTYMSCFIKESMRMIPPVHAYARILEEPMVIDGVKLLKGQTVLIYPQFIHHNPLVWENHREFKPERFYPENIQDKSPYAFLPFSAGQRNCIGQHFALNEIKVVLSKVLQRFKIRLDPLKEAKPFPDIVQGAVDGIYLYFEELNTDETSH